MNVRSLLIAALAVVSMVLPGGAVACSIIISEKSLRAAFAEADMVVDVLALSESYLPPLSEPGIRVGLATARVTKNHKGRAREGATISYRVVDGDDGLCPANSFTRPGQSYRLYLKYAGDDGPPVIIVPTFVKNHPAP